MVPGPSFTPAGISGHFASSFLIIIWTALYLSARSVSWSSLCLVCTTQFSSPAQPFARFFSSPAQPFALFSPSHQWHRGEASHRALSFLEELLVVLLTWSPGLAGPVGYVCCGATSPWSVPRWLWGCPGQAQPLPRRWAGISSSALSSTPLFVQPALLFALWFVSSLLLRFVPVSQSPVLTWSWFPAVFLLLPQGKACLLLASVPVSLCECWGKEVI